MGDTLYTLTDSNWTCSRGRKTPPVPAEKCGGKAEDFFRAFAVSISNRYRAAFGRSQPYFIKSLADRPTPFGEVRGTEL